MSWAVTTQEAPVSPTNAAPTASAISSSSSSGTMPRMSYALKIFAYCPTSAFLRYRLATTDAWTTSLPAGGRRPAAVARAGRPAAARLRGPAPVLRGGAQHPQVATPADLDPLADRLDAGGREDRLPDRVGQRLQVVGLGRVRVGRIDGEADHVPAPGGREPRRVSGAQVVTVGLHVGGERAEHGGGVAVDVGERVQGGLPAGGPGADAGHQRPTPPVGVTAPGVAMAASSCARPEPGSRASPTTADRTYPGPLKPPPGHCSRRVSRKDVRSAPGPGCGGGMSGTAVPVRAAGQPAGGPGPGQWRYALDCAQRRPEPPGARGQDQAARPAWPWPAGGPGTTGRSPAPDPGGGLR